MATFSSVTRTHVLQAIAEYDSRGGEDFLALYGFTPDPDHRILHEGRTYDARAVLGLAHRFATGRLATQEEFSSMDPAVTILRRREFDVLGPAGPAPAAPVRARRAPSAPRAPRTTKAHRSPSTRASASREIVHKLCPTCSMTLPGTGICDSCS